MKNPSPVVDSHDLPSFRIENEREIAQYKKNLEKEIENTAISLCAVVLNKLKYKNSTTEKIEEKLSKFIMKNNV